MTERCFVDTNIILYAASDDPAEAAKHQRALTLLDSVEVCVSAQVLQEFYVNAVRRTRDPDVQHRIGAWIDRQAKCPIVPTDAALVAAAIRNSLRYKISYWDAAILAAAEVIGAGVLYTEDLNHGQRYGTVLVQNPFRDP